MGSSTNIFVDEALAKTTAASKQFVIMFNAHYFCIGPFDSWAEADEYGMRRIEPKLRGTDVNWRIMPLTLPFG